MEIISPVTLSRPKAFNALSTPLMLELNQALQSFDKDTSTGAIVLTGNEKAFAGIHFLPLLPPFASFCPPSTNLPSHFLAGADIKEMTTLTFSEAYNSDFIEVWSHVTTTLKKPLLAAVNGYALGGGCELAMMADIIYCSANATFGQPEIKLGIIPGAGGSQRLTRAIGKSRAMDLILTGRSFTGQQAGEWGLAARVFDDAETCVQGAMETAEIIAGYSRVAVKAAKEVVNKSQEVGLRDGVEFERRVFHGLFGSRDQKIGESKDILRRGAGWNRVC